MLAEEPDWTVRSLGHLQTAGAPFRTAYKDPDLVGRGIQQQVFRFWFARARRKAEVLPQEEQARVLKTLLRHWTVHDTALKLLRAPAWQR